MDKEEFGRSHMGEAYSWLVLRNFACHDVAKTILAVGYVLESGDRRRLVYW